MQSQMVRAAESIYLNIAEGCGASTPREFARFLDMAIKSMCEIEAALELSKEYRVLSERGWRLLTRDVVDVRKMTYGLRQKVLAAATDDALRTTHNAERALTSPARRPTRPRKS